MIAIISMTFLGVIAGMFTGFYTRIIKYDMILSFIGDRIEKINKSRVLKTGRGDLSPKALFLKCIFCLTPWVVFLLELFYILEYEPYWINAVIGVIGGIGSGNLVAELIYAIRND